VKIKGESQDESASMEGGTEKREREKMCNRHRHKKEENVEEKS
jgi:hypothetical protein